MKNNFIQLSCWLILMVPILLSGQSSSILDDYIDQALANNLSIQSIGLDQARQSSKVDQAKKLWQPKIDLDVSYLFAEGGRTIIFPVGDLFNPAYGAINRLSGNNEFPTDLENFETQLTPNNYLDASLSISKPIINSAIKYNLLIQQALMSLSDVDLDIQQNQLRYQVKQAYFNYIKSLEGTRIIADNIVLLNQVLVFNQKLIKYDKATPDVISDVEYQIALMQSEILNLDEQRAITKVLFNIILNRDIDSDIIIDSTVLNDVSSSTLGYRSFLDQAINSRPEFRKIKIADDVNNLNVQRINAGKSPTLNVRGAVGIQSEEFSFDEGGPLYTLGLSLGWNLWDGGLRKKQTEELFIAREQNKLENERIAQQITLQVAQAFHELRALYAQLSAQEVAISAASTSYNAINRRYQNEKALLIELLSAQNKWTTSLLKKTILEIDILIAQANLERIIYDN